MKDGGGKAAVVPSAGESRPTLLRRRLDTRDFDEVAHAMRGWDADFRKIGRGPFRGELDLVQAGGVQVLRIDFDRVIQVRAPLAQEAARSPS